MEKIEEKNNLKKCPFCGKRPKYISDESIRCDNDNCSCFMFGDLSKIDRNKLIEKWNKRVKIKSLESQLESRKNKNSLFKVKFSDLVVKPCPCCGKKPQQVFYSPVAGQDGDIIRCKNCRIILRSNIGMEDLIEKWNQREKYYESN